MKKKKSIARDWEAIYRDFRESEMSVSGFARARRIPLSSFRGFLYRTGRMSVAEGAQAAQARETKSKGAKPQEANARKTRTPESFARLVPAPVSCLGENKGAPIIVSVGKARILVDKSTDLELICEILRAADALC